MKSLTDQEYIELCQKLVDQQYDDAIEDYDINKMEWIPAEPEVKKQLQANVNGMIDLTTVRSSEIKKQIQLCTNFKVGKFKLRLSRYFEQNDQATPKYTVEVWEEKDRTPNGMPCRIDFPIDLAKDKRFAGRPWLKHFRGSYGRDVPLDTVVEIMRWMQAIKKLIAFL